MRAATLTDPTFPLRRRLATVVALVALLASAVCLRVAYEARMREQHVYRAAAPYRSRVSFAAPSVNVTMKRLSYSVSAMDGASAIPS
jgi:ferric-dicitrate binding protein FerR (iron transport regulator)